MPALFVCRLWRGGGWSARSWGSGTELLCATAMALTPARQKVRARPSTLAGRSAHNPFLQSRSLKAEKTALCSSPQVFACQLQCPQSCPLHVVVRWKCPSLLRRGSLPLGVRHMANEAAKKRVIKNREVIGKYRLILLGTNVRATPAHWRSPLHTNAGFRRRRAGAVRALPRCVPVGHVLALAHGRVRSAPHRLRRRLVHADQGSGASVRPAPPSTAEHRRPA